jgi:hypothetical protein
MRPKELRFLRTFRFFNITLDLVYIGMDITFTLQSRRHHTTDFTVDGPLGPGTIVHTENPCHSGMGIRIPTIQEILIIQGQDIAKCLFRRG